MATVNLNLEYISLDKADYLKEFAGGLCQQDISDQDIANGNYVLGVSVMLMR
jgi:hypothetical protein